MPSPSTPRRTSNRHDGKSTTPKPKPVDVGIPLGPYDSNTVQDRIRQWQAQGGGVITASDIYVDEEVVEPAPKIRSAKRSEKGIVSKDEADATENRDSQTSKRRAGRRKDKVEVEEQPRNRSGSAPKKRVISDAHWRKDRSPPESTGLSRAEALPDDGIRVRPMPEPGSATSSKDGKASTAKGLPDDGIRVKPIPYKTDEPWKYEKKKFHSKYGSGTEGNGSTTYGASSSSGRQPSRLQTPEDEKSNYGFHTVDGELQSQRSPLSTSSRNRKTSGQSADHTPDPSHKLGGSAGATESNRRKSHYRKEITADKTPRSTQGAFSDNRGSRKGNILSQVFGESRKVFARTEQIIVSAPRIPSIEAWLSDTPDPFVDGDEAPVEIPAPLNSKSKHRGKKEANATIPDDPNKIWEVLETQARSADSGLGNRRRRRVRSSTLYEENPLPKDLGSGSTLDNSVNGGVSAATLVGLVPDESDLSSPVPPSSSLRRRGAKRDSSSPGKDGRHSSPLKDLFLLDEEDSVVSSVNTTSSVEPVHPFTPLRPAGLNIKRPFPSFGTHKLSTIASVETFITKEQGVLAQSILNLPETVESKQRSHHDPENSHDEARDQFDPDGLNRQPGRSRLAKHSDLISVLSLPMGRSGSIRSARSIRTNRSRLANATIEDLMEELATDESKYMRELRTLVDGVIPVLLTCVLSKSDSAVAAGLFNASAHGKNDPNITKPIIDMGIALEQLKTLHKRIPLNDADALLTWAQGAQKVYSEYLKAWRLGFQDVVVNLASAPDNTDPKTGDGLEEGLPRNANGDIINTNGERVDVAYLLKRPLVRLKYLSKTLKSINFVKPSPEAEGLAMKYQNLVIDARNRSNEERARLEDQAAANIDPTRARDPRTLGPLAGVTIDRTRRVRARDYFNLAVQHSTGQRIDCRIELLIRDDAPDKGNGGDLLICEVDGTGRWLLFPPVQFGRVSARNGDGKGEIVVMIRGIHGHLQEWSEMLELYIEDEQTGFEWVQMLGLAPVPPKIVRSQSFLDRRERRKTLSMLSASELEPANSKKTLARSRTPSPREVEVPIGEQASVSAATWVEASDAYGTLPSLISSAPRERNRLQKRLPPTPEALQPYDKPLPSVNDRQALPSHRKRDSITRTLDSPRSPKSLNEALHLAGTSALGLRRARARRESRHLESVGSPKSPSSPAHEDDLQRPSTQMQETEWTAHSLSPELLARSSSHPVKSSPGDTTKSTPCKEKRLSHHRSQSSVPSLQLPVIPKLRGDNPPHAPTHEEIDISEWAPAPVDKDLLPKTPSKLVKERPVEPTRSEQPPPPPIHRSSSPVQITGSQTPDLNPTAGRRVQRRSSSPLKHEYEPSTASESSSDSDASTMERNEATSVSESDSSEDEELEDGDAPTPLIPLGALQRLQRVSPHGSVYSHPNSSLSPSSSASQAPFKRVPAQPSKASKTIASILFWSDNPPSWKPLHPDECSIVVTPGLIEAFEMSASHSQTERPTLPPQAGNDTTSDFSERSSRRASDPQLPKPLIALELTPLVLMRQGTALDIFIRSPPTAGSKIAMLSNSSNNMMFRSRNPEECQALYTLINYSRINNPTYIALQNARVTSSFVPSFDRSNSTRGSSRSTSWFGLGHSSRSSYRVSSAPTPSISMSESSIGSMSSAFSALKRFGLGGSRFSISRSTVTSRNGSRANSIYTSSDNSSGSGTSTPAPPGPGVPAEDSKTPPSPSGPGGPIGLSNAKIRLYIRETASKWRDLGSARLTIMRPTNAAHPPLEPEQQQKGANDKRIVVIGKAKGETLLDVTLGESCFERVARTGIAVSVWEAFEGGLVAKEGGVVGGRLRVFMIQMKGEAETAYTFSIVGKLRY